MGTWSLVSGWLPWSIRVIGTLALAALLACRSGPFWTRRVLLVVAASAALVAVIDLIIQVVWRPFPDRIPLNNLVWVAVALAALGLAVLRARAGSWWRRAAALGAALIVVVAAGAEINTYWGAYPYARSLYDALRPLPPAASPPARGGPVIAAPPGHTLAEVWQAPETIPAAGQVSRVRIPGNESRFKARAGYLYLPPAYLVSPRPLLPVVVLVAGQPGSPAHWINWMRLADTLDGYARTHEGLAPVALVVDDLGSFTGNPLCVDSPLGHAETYLTQDVPAWIRANLQVTTQRQGWFIGGYSDGGTCSLQMALRAPGVYGGFVDIAGSRGPSLGGHTETVQRAFGGSAAAFARANPLDELQHSTFPSTAAFLAAGTDDADSIPDQLAVRDGCRAAGVNVTWVELPGGHTLTMWRDAFQQAVPWLAKHGQITTT